ncbi:MAG: hypothetical protein L6420_05235 [Elusimicrobia bacterium]|nr:hypothetical protein [Elusimicrobiota bacterium]
MKNRDYRDYVMNILKFYSNRQVSATMPLGIWKIPRLCWVPSRHRRDVHPATTASAGKQTAKDVSPVNEVTRGERPKKRKVLSAVRTLQSAGCGLKEI